MKQKITQAIMHGTKDIRLEEKEMPELAENKVLVKVKSCGLCTWENKMYHNEDSTAFPFAGGHEIYGVVEEVGAGIYQDLKPGDQVAVAKLTRCGECYYCRRGDDHLCENAGEDSSGLWGPGGFAEYITAYGYEVNKFNNLSYQDTATLAEPLACVVRSIERAQLNFGDSLLVIGAGIMGYLNAILGKRLGVSVIVSEPNDYRRNHIAKNLEVATVNPFAEDVVEYCQKFTQGRGVDAVIFTAGNIAALQEGVECLGFNGRLVVYGSVRSEGKLEISPSLLHYDEVYLTGVTKHTKKSFAKAVDILESEGEKFQDLISKRIRFTDIELAFQEMEEPENYRIVIDF